MNRMLPLLLLLFATALRADVLETRLAALATSVDGELGVGVVVLEGGPATLLRGDQRFPMQSVYKLPITMHVLRLVDQRKLSLDQKIAVRKSDMVGPGAHSPLRDAYPDGVTLTLRELLRRNLSESDGTACDVLLRLSGGTSAVMKFLASIGVRGIEVRDSEKELGRNNDLQYRNSASPRAALELLRAFHEGRGLKKESTALLRQWMIDSPTGLQRIRGGLPSGTIVAHKTGTSGTRDGLTAATNDIGIITLPDGRHLAVAMFLKDSRADQAAREGVIAEVARAAWEAAR